MGVVHRRRMRQPGWLFFRNPEEFVVDHPLIAMVVTAKLSLPVQGQQHASGEQQWIAQRHFWGQLAGLSGPSCASISPAHSGPTFLFFFKILQEKEIGSVETLRRFTAKQMSSTGSTLFSRTSSLASLK